MNLRSIFLSIFFLLPLHMFASLTGTYTAIGVGPSGQEYTAEVVIVKNDSIYTIYWVFEDLSIDVGTGVRQGDSIAFVFQENFSTPYGVQLYHIECHTLLGPWARFGATKEGFELIEKISDETVIPILVN